MLMTLCQIQLTKVNYAAGPFLGGFVSFLPLCIFYFHCNGFCNGNHLCSFGTSSIIKKVPALTSFGNLVYDNELILTGADVFGAFQIIFDYFSSGQITCRILQHFSRN